MSREYQAIISWTASKWADIPSEESLVHSLSEIIDGDNIKVYALQARHVDTIDDPILCPAGDRLETQAICRSFVLNPENGWCVHFDDDHFCDDLEIKKLMNEE
jgi:hypothetical protein